MLSQKLQNSITKIALFEGKQIRRLIQSIPSPNAEPFKLWLAKAFAQEPSLSRIKTVKHGDFLSTFHDYVTKTVKMWII